MHRSFLIVCLVVVTAFAAVAVVPRASANANRPTWLVGDYWEWRFVGTAPGVSNGVVRMEVVGVETVRVGGVNYPSWRLQTTENFTTTGGLTSWSNRSGSSWFRVSDLALVKRDVSGTREWPGFSTTVAYRTEWDPPQDIAWPLTTAASWSWAGWMNHTSMTDAQPPRYDNYSLATDFVVEPDTSVTVPAGTFITTPVNGTDVSGDINVTYWSPAAGNYAFLRSYTMGMQIYYIELVAYRYYVDTAPPTITGVTAVPGNQAAGGYVNLSATITDDTRVASASVNVTQPDGTHVNRTMAGAPSNRWYSNATWSQVGAHTFVVWAFDISGKSSSAAGTFTVRPPDTERPRIAHTPPAGPIPTDTAITIQATVTDNDRVEEVKLEFTNVSGATQNVTMAAPGSTYAYTIPAQPSAGTVRYRIYAVDPSGNANVTQEFTLTIESPSTGLDPVVVYGLIGIVVLIAAIAAAAIVIRKRRGRTEPPTEPPPTPP